MKNKNCLLFRLDCNQHECCMCLNGDPYIRERLWFEKFNTWAVFRFGKVTFASLFKVKRYFYQRWTVALPSKAVVTYGLSLHVVLSPFQRLQWQYLGKESHQCDLSWNRKCLLIFHLIQWVFALPWVFIYFGCSRL